MTVVTGKKRLYSPCRGGDVLLDCLGDLDSPRPAAPVDDPMMSIQNLRRLRAATGAGADASDQRPEGHDGVGRESCGRL